MEYINVSKNNFMSVFTKNKDFSFKIADIESSMSSYNEHGDLSFLTIWFESGNCVEFDSDDFKGGDDELKNVRDSLTDYINDREDWAKKRNG